MSTETYLTVEEALRGWLNGEKLQCRPKNGSLHTNEQEFEGWKTFGSPSTVKGVYISTDTHDYRFKPKPRVAWAVYCRGGELVGAYEDRASANEVADHWPKRTVVRMVEQPE